MIDREDAKALGLLVARSPSHAAGMLLVALHAVEPRPKLRSDVEVGAHQIDVVVEHEGRRMAVLLGRTGEHRTEVDKARDAALERAGWAIYRLTPGRVEVRPQRAVADVLAALRERGAEVPPPVPAKRREGGPPPPGLLRDLCNELGRRPGAPT